jgi:hypothetical protein
MGVLKRLVHNGIYNNWKVLGVGEPYITPNSGIMKSTSIVECLVCGAIHTAQNSSIRGQHSKSCRSCGNVKHGMRGSLEYNSWDRMIQRCYNPNNKDFYRYGGRGITVYEPWRTNFQLWFDHIGPRPGSEYSQDRIRNNEGYIPGNVCWATREEQNNNKRNTIYLKINDEVLSLTAMCDKYNVNRNVTLGRLHSGQSDHEAIFGVRN